jgi:hypothetical protein
MTIKVPCLRGLRNDQGWPAWLPDQPAGSPMKVRSSRSFTSPSAGRGPRPPTSLRLTVTCRCSRFHRSDSPCSAAGTPTPSSLFLIHVHAGRSRVWLAETPLRWHARTWRPARYREPSGLCSSDFGPRARGTRLRLDRCPALRSVDPTSGTGRAAMPGPCERVEQVDREDADGASIKAASAVIDGRRRRKRHTPL